MGILLKSATCFLQRLYPGTFWHAREPIQEVPTCFYPQQSIWCWAPVPPRILGDQGPCECQPESTLEILSAGPLRRQSADSTIGTPYTPAAQQWGVANVSPSYMLSAFAITLFALLFLMTGEPHGRARQTSDIALQHANHCEVKHTFQMLSWKLKPSKSAKNCKLGR